MLSGGTRQKVNAVMAFLFRPDLFILDEPTAGLDPLSSSVLKDKILAMRGAGRTFIVTSHIMSELEELADDVAFMLEGQTTLRGHARGVEANHEAEYPRARHRDNDAARLGRGGGMNTILKVLKYQMRDAVRSRWLLAYALFFMLVTQGLLSFSGDAMKTQLSLVSVVLFLVPLVSIVFGTVYLYNSREFIELLLAQPVNRRQMYAGVYLGLAIPLTLAFIAGLGVPFLVHGVDESARTTVAALLVAGVVLTMIFTALATLIAMRCDDRLRGLGAAIGVWMLLTVVYDGFVLLILAVFSNHALEHATLGMMMANPIDLARVALLLRFDGAAMMGYTGAVFLNFFTGAQGATVMIAALGLWVIVPVALGAHAFQRKDF